jgi:hypothetical protein
MLTCREAVRLVSAREDRPLRPAERLGLLFHLMICTWCRRFAHQVRVLTGVLRAGPADVSMPPDARLDAESRARIRTRLSRPV